MAASDLFIAMRRAQVRRAGRIILSVDGFSLRKGESIAILGPNGAGKSTFVKLITREVLPLHQEEPPVVFCGNSRATLADVKATVGVVSSSMQDQMTVHLPVLDVVVGGLFGSLGVPQRFEVSEIHRAAALSALDEIGMGALASRDVMTLSSGQARRVLIARALVHDPAMLVLDEPCTGLDPEGIFYVRKTMRELARSGRGIVLVTHHPEDVVPEIRRVVLVKDGFLVADGAKEDVLTSEALSDLFGVPLEVVCVKGSYLLLDAC